ncbi:class I SAM-dependent methyltransferase [Agromyces aerolatus]|uniref:class I SAM-dependent methyltransferase n=1 Tax=Agromyces sp. LY-1074 TaxID=3074080 RepID=UPI0028608FC2|nr:MULTISPECIES: class I SAM-dependent methyltransferase [unclassified Agromyces]MDR5698874.1 class I SAM-dependent methyltransferase [Agromyces sp. LY-1074]MDR5705348.1 class I SAM-dependent methyltransferase [Agromyces sp. LY-1358]
MTDTRPTPDRSRSAGALGAPVVADPSDPRTQQTARSFGAAASVYQASRPGYPAEAVAWLIGDAATVLDLGAGTGKLTEALVALDRDVIAVDPVEEMLEELELRVPGVPRVLGTAEDIPLEDGRVDAVVAGQAWHWFQRARAIPEIARVLRPGGTLGLVWNSRDTRTGWLHEAGELMHERYDASTTYASTVQIGAPFGAVEEVRVEWVQRMTRSTFLDLVRSRSHFLTASQADQRETIAAVKTLLLTHPDLAGAAELAVPYVTHCFRTRLEA